MKRHILLLPFALLLASCRLPGDPNPVAFQDQAPLREAVDQFTDALARGDARALDAITTVDPDPDARRLARAVREDTLLGRRLQLALADRFHAADDKPGVVGSDAWIGLFQQTLARGPYLRLGNRARIGDETADGVIFLREQAGRWKVEFIPTLVAESGGRQTVPDPLVEYRYNVSCAVNEWFLSRLERGEFADAGAYRKARNDFWFDYMTAAAAGKDPHDVVLPSLPRVPDLPAGLAMDR